MPKIIGDTWMVAYGTQGRSRRFGLYECPSCFTNFQSAVDHVHSGNITKCSLCSIKASKEAVITKFKDTFLASMYAVHGTSLSFDMTTYVNTHKHV